MTVAVFADQGFAPTAHLGALGGSVDLAEDVQQLIVDIVKLYDEAHYYIHCVRGRDGRQKTAIIVLKEDLISEDRQLELKVRHRSGWNIPVRKRRQGPEMMEFKLQALSKTLSMHDSKSFLPKH